MTRLQNWRTQMYLSRIKLNTQKRETMKALVNPQQIHGAIEVLNGEPSEASDAADEKNRARSLWRIDTLGGEMYLLVLTQDRPKLSRAAEQLGYGGINVETKSYDPLLARIAEGSRWRFRLTANPTKSIKREDDPQARGKVTPLFRSDSRRSGLLLMRKVTDLNSRPMNSVLFIQTGILSKNAERTRK